MNRLAIKTFVAILRRPTTLSSFYRCYQHTNKETFTKMRTVDLRSDTVTRPTAAMREAMAKADVGDDVMREDPTVMRLEKYCAQMFGKESALFVPSASMANIIAIMLHCEKWGSEVIVGQRQHIVKYERGNTAHLARCSVAILPNEADGTIALSAIRAAIRDKTDIHQPRTRLICLENTHNVCGGKVLPSGYVKQVREIANEAEMKIHLDGSRLMNASVASNCTIAELCADVDSVTFCLSKGVGAPVGAVLGGSNEFVEEARKLRKSLGGGMRQVGVLAAAALVGLGNVRERMTQDHKNAKRLVDAINNSKSQMKCQPADTNIVFLNTGNVDADELSDKLEAEGILCFALTDHSIRFVTHSDLSEDDITFAIEKINSVCSTF